MQFGGIHFWASVRLSCKHCHYFLTFFNTCFPPRLKNFANRLTDLSANYNICPDVAEIISEPHPEIQTTTQYTTTTEGISEECKLGLLMSSAADPMDTGAGFFGATNESRYEYQGLGREYITE